MGLDWMAICTRRRARLNVSVIRRRIYAIRVRHEVGRKLMLFDTRRLVEAASVVCGIEARDGH